MIAFLIFVGAIIIAVISIKLYISHVEEQEEEIEAVIKKVEKQKLLIKERLLKEQEIAKEKLIDEIRLKYRAILDRALTTYELKVCPKCYEIEMEFQQFSPTAQSMTCRCTHCSKEQIFKLLPGKNGYDILNQFIEIAPLVESVPVKLGSELWLTGFDNKFFVKNINDSAKLNEGIKRDIMPESVRHEVWRRDNGRCVNCGSNENLEFDHIIPISKGGANTTRNLQLLCEPCNRKKSAKI